MKLLLIFLVSIYVLSVHCEGNSQQKHWALLVAGSNGYYNYRHQADICHAYHIVSRHGIPDEQIVVMMYDDIANNPDNPFPGNIINQPDGPNLYPGVLKDYTGENVNPEMFLKVLSGDSEGVEKLLGKPGKVIKSGPNDTVFVNFADHGAPGILAFPHKFLHANDLNDVIVKMHENKQYKDMVFYVEACESGSVFQNILRKDINVFATTAANADQSSFACYYDKKRETYLGDVYSVNWMQDSGKENLHMETLQKQFRIVKRETNTSHVMEFGDMSMKTKRVGDFQGNVSDNTLFFHQEMEHNPNDDAVPSEDVTLEILKRKVESYEGEKKSYHQAAITKLLKNKKDTKKLFKKIVQLMANTDYDSLLKMSVQFTGFECYRESVTILEGLCPGLDLVRNDYALRNLRTIANLCEMENVPKENVWSSIKKAAVTSSFCRDN